MPLLANFMISIESLQLTSYFLPFHTNQINKAANSYYTVSATSLYSNEFKGK